jgi:hypothetical protein
MYNLYLFKGIFEEAELLVAGETFFARLGQLMDDKMADRVQNFWDRCDESEALKTRGHVIMDRLRESVEMSKKILGETVFTNRFPTLVREKGLVEKLSTVTPTLLRYYSDDLKDLQALVKWFTDHRKYWRRSYEARTSDNYKAFLEEVQRMEKEVLRIANSIDLSTVHITPMLRLSDRVRDNREFFYTPHEKNRTTGLYDLITKGFAWDLIQHGIDYLAVLGAHEHAVSARERRQF